MEQPYQHAMYDEMFCLETGLWHNFDKAAVADTLTVNDLRAFYPSLFAFAQVTILVHGNMLAEEAIDLANTIQSKLQYKPLLPSEIPELRVVKLSHGTRYVRSVRELNPQDENSASVVCFEIGEDTPANNALIELLAQVCRDAVYHQLRTVEQLGYLVWSGVATHRGVIYFRIIVQSANFDAMHLENRIEAFIAHFGSELRNMNLDQFSKHVHSVIARKSEKDKTLVNESNRHWHEITLRRYTFDRAAREVRHLERISHQMLVEFFNTYVLNPETRAKLSIQVHGKNHPMPSEDELQEQFSPKNSPSLETFHGDSVTNHGFDGSIKVEQIRTEQIVEVAAAPILEKDASNTTASNPPFLPSIPVDTAPLVVIHDMLKFKSSMPLHPCYI
jgi:secreted Zn-dependent insulinase-like peptidase